MVLGFKQYFPWKGEDGKPEPTNFREKILVGTGNISGNLIRYARHSDVNQISSMITSVKPKIHTFREDTHNRWKAGMKVSMVYRGAGYKIIDHFNEGIPDLDTIKSIQKIKISCTQMPKKGGYNPELYWPKIEVDGKVIGDIPKTLVYRNGEAQYITTDKEPVVKLVQNDGFESITKFCMWFNKDWSGKILHFTDFRYE